MRYSKTCECEIVQESGHSGSQRLALHRNERVQRSADEYRGGILSIASVRTNHSGVRRRGHADLDVDHHGPLSSIHTQSTYFPLHFHVGFSFSASFSCSLLHLLQRII